MPELATDFQSLPPEYQAVIRLAQETHKITVTPLQLLVGGWSGAVVYLASISSHATNMIEHCILKLDRKGKAAKSDEVTRHHTVLHKSAPEFARAHIAELIFDRVEHEGAIAIFYRIAGQSLLNYRPLSSYERQSQLKTIFTQTNHVLLSKWNADAVFLQAVHPQKVLEKWLGFRLDAGGNIEQFLQDICGIHADIPGVLINGRVFPNPLLYARRPEPWGSVRSMDVIQGLIHGDLNTNNVLVKFSDNKETLEGYYLIDFALFKEGMPLLYDQRYLEMSYLMHAMSQVSFAKRVNFLTLLAVADIPDPYKMPIEASGISAVLASARSTFSDWVRANHPSLHDDLWGQYWLGGVAAGLSYCHKPGLANEQRLAALIYAAANLKRYTVAFGLPLPAKVEPLYHEFSSELDSPLTSNIRKPKHNLPSQTTPFIGRTGQIAAIKALLFRPDVRLVTLIGPGGTGKTRLSLQVAHEMVPQLPHGVYFIPLADDKDANQLLSRVAQQLQVREGSRPLLENIKDYLRDKHMLLVLDNFEQLVSAAPMVADILAAAPQLKILVTSRVTLALHGEREFPVPPLLLPQSEEELHAKALAENESVMLFIERARAVQPGFMLTENNISTVAEICRRLDGLPLALELAAARIKILTPQALLARLDDRLKLLTGGARDLPSRHQTLRNTLEWSYSLLSPQEKTLYARLSVFVGGFTLEAAEAICNAEGKLDILEVLTSLVNNSLLRQETASDSDPRFGMLETIRAYALERLADNGELDALRAAHAAYFGGIVTNRAMFGLYSPASLSWLNWLEREHDNVRATLSWSLATPQGIELGARIVFAMVWFWYRRGYFIEGYTWADRILASPALPAMSISRALALQASGMLAIWKGEQEIALAQLQKSLELQQRLEDEDWMAYAILVNAVAMINMGRDAAAQPLLEQALPMFQERNDVPFQAVTLIHLGNVQLGLENAEQARVLHERALEIARSLGETWLESFALNNLGEVARTQGQYELARTYYEECQSLLSTTGDTGDLARFVHNLGYIAQHEGDYMRAESQFRQGLTMFRRLGNRRGIAECLAGLAGLKARQGDSQWGGIMLSAAESLLKSTGGAWWPADRMEVERNLEIIRSSLSTDQFTEAWQKGEAMTIDEAIRVASQG